MNAEQERELKTADAGWVSELRQKIAEMDASDDQRVALGHWMDGASQQEIPALVWPEKMRAAHKAVITAQIELERAEDALTALRASANNTLMQACKKFAHLEPDVWKAQRRFPRELVMCYHNRSGADLPPEGLVEITPAQDHTRLASAPMVQANDQRLRQDVLNAVQFYEQRKRPVLVQDY